jgi:hypothetical protein
MGTVQGIMRRDQRQCVSGGIGSARKVSGRCVCIGGGRSEARCKYRRCASVEGIEGVAREQTSVGD